MLVVMLVYFLSPKFELRFFNSFNSLSSTELNYALYKQFSAHCFKLSRVTMKTTL